jgi:hypothetical protein
MPPLGEDLTLEDKGLPDLLEEQSDHIQAYNLDEGDESDEGDEINYPQH